MGYVRVKGELGDPDWRTVLQVDFLADKGAFLTAISGELARKIGINAVTTTKALWRTKQRLKWAFRTPM